LQEEGKGSELLGRGGERRETGCVVKPKAGVLSSQIFLAMATAGIRMSCSGDSIVLRM